MKPTPTVTNYWLITKYGSVIVHVYADGRITINLLDVGPVDA